MYGGLCKQGVKRSNPLNSFLPSDLPSELGISCPRTGVRRYHPQCSMLCDQLCLSSAMPLSVLDTAAGEGRRELVLELFGGASDLSEGDVGECRILSSAVPMLLS